MHFYNCEFNILRILSQLSNHIDMLAKEKTTRLNPMAALSMQKGNNIEFDIESWEKWSDASDASENETNKWIAPTTRIIKKYACN